MKNPFSFDIARTEKDLIEVYDYIYSHPPKRGLRPYAGHHGRVGMFDRTIRRRLRSGSSILEVGCGRGELIVRLLRRGYTVIGTEISEWLFEHDLSEFPAIFLPCSRLGEIPDKSFDAVVSSDVLEHLIDEAAAIDAMRNFARIARKFCVLSVGKDFARQYPKKLKIAAFIEENGALHRVRKPHEWWVARFSESFEVEQEVEGRSTMFMVGKPLD